MIEGIIVKIEAGGFDKYGRLLNYVYVKEGDGTETQLNNYLINHKMAFSYDGGKKKKFTQADYDAFLEAYGDYTWPTFINYPY